MRKVGETIKFQGHRLKVTIDTGCDKCFFRNDVLACTRFRDNVEYCSSEDREDDFSIQFIEMFFKYGK